MVEMYSEVSSYPEYSWDSENILNTLNMYVYGGNFHEFETSIPNISQLL